MRAASICLGHPQVAWIHDAEDGKVNWIHLFMRLAAAAIFVLVGDAGPRTGNPLIAGLLHYNEMASTTAGFMGLHSVGGNTYSLASVTDTLAWLASPPIACVLGSISNIGLLFHLPGRYGLEHCRIRLHRPEASVMGRTSELVGYAAYIQNRLSASYGFVGPWFGQTYLNARECIGYGVLIGDTQYLPHMVQSEFVQHRS